MHSPAVQVAEELREGHQQTNTYREALHKME